ncbi:MAG: hypothetical protein IAF58_20810 [Leptolyngbya sp.]|nr:hypothetical protein [Candidatus Melainabacteria bacterium]
MKENNLEVKEVKSERSDSASLSAPLIDNKDYVASLVGRTSNREVEDTFGTLTIDGLSGQTALECEKTAWLGGQKPSDIGRSMMEEIKVRFKENSVAVVMSEAARLANYNFPLFADEREKQAIKVVVRDLFNKELGDKKVTTVGPYGPASGYMHARIEEKGNLEVNLYAQPGGKGGLVKPQNSQFYR